MLHENLHKLEQSICNVVYILISEDSVDRKLMFVLSREVHKKYSVAFSFPHSYSNQTCVRWEVHSIVSSIIILWFTKIKTSFINFLGYLNMFQFPPVDALGYMILIWTGNFQKHVSRWWLKASLRLNYYFLSFHKEFSLHMLQ